MQTLEGTGSSDLAALQAAHCLGVIEGVRETMSLWQDTNERAKLSMKGVACIPDDVTPLQATKVVVKYMDAHPESLHVLGSALVAIALRDAFPCPTQSHAP